MKKLMMRCLLALLCLCMAVPSAMAATVEVLPEREEYHNILNMVTVGDTVYMLDSSGIEARLLRWTEDMPQVEFIAEGLLYAERFDTLAQAEESADRVKEGVHADAVHALNYIFSDGEKLYGMNAINRLVFTIDVGEDGLSYTDVVTLPKVGERSYIYPLSTVICGDWLLWCGRESGEVKLLVYSLRRGTVKQAVLEKLRGVASYKDGKVLVRCAGDESDVLLTYDPETDETVTVGSIGTYLGYKPMVYDRAADMLVYQQQTCLMGWCAESGTEQVGYVPCSYVRDMAVAGSHLVWREDDSLTYACDIRRGFTTEKSLTLLKYSDYDTIRAFSESHPDTPVYLTTIGTSIDVVDAMTDAEKGVDMLVAYSDNGDLDTLIDAGALQDLSANAEIKAYIDTLYPVYREYVTRDGAIYGVPLRANSNNGWFINKEVMTAMGLTAEDIPTNLVDLIAFADKWDSEYLEKYPHFTLMNEVGSYRLAFLEQILTDWSVYCQAQGKALNYDDPIFRQLLTALDSADFTNLDASLQQTDPEVSEYKQALIWRGCPLVGNWGSYMEDFSDRIFLPMTLTADTEFVAAVESLAVFTISAGTDAQADAMDFLLTELGTQSEKQAHVLRADCTEPVMGEYADEIITAAEETLARLENAMADTVNPATAEKKIAEQKAYMAGEMLSQVYDIMPSAIENYVNVIAPALVIYTPDAVDETMRSAEIAICIAQYCGGYDLEPLDADGFIAQMNALVGN